MENKSLLVDRTFHPLLNAMHDSILTKMSLKGIYLSKALTCMKISCINQNCFFVNDFQGL